MRSVVIVGLLICGLLGVWALVFIGHTLWRYRK